MKIKTQITLSYIIIILVITLSLMYFCGHALDIFSIESTECTKTAISNIVFKNSETTRKMLSEYAKRIISIEAKNIAQELSFTFKELGKPYDTTEIAKNQKLMKTLTSKDTYSLNESSGCFFIMDSNARIIIPATPSPECENVATLKKQYPEVWSSVKSSLNRYENYREFRFKEPDDETTKAYMVMTKIPETPFLLCAMADITSLVQAMQKKIETAGNEIETSSKENMRTILRQAQAHYKNISIMVTVVILCCGLLYGIWFGNYISKPIEKLQSAIKDLKEGKLPEKLKEAGTSETKLITKSFNDMTSVLRKEDVQAAIQRARQRKMDIEKNA